MPNIRVLAEGLEFPEGPVAMPDGSVILVEIRGKKLTRVHPDGRREVVAQVPGGPNGAALGPDGKMWICNNGGFTWGARGMSGALQRPIYRRLIQGRHPERQSRDRVRQVRRQSAEGSERSGVRQAGGLWFTDLGKRYERQTDNGGPLHVARRASSARSCFR